MSKYAIQPAREGYTTYTATLESFGRNFINEETGEFDSDLLDKGFEFETIEAAQADAAIVADTTKKRVLIIERKQFTNANYLGIGWVSASGEYSEGV
jgi:hypothetical protein